MTRTHVYFFGIIVLAFAASHSGLSVQEINLDVAAQREGENSPTILVSEVRSWCIADPDCDRAELQFIPGSAAYFDRVRMAPVNDDVISEGYIGFEVPQGYSATYWSSDSTREFKEANVGQQIFAAEAIFTKVQ